MIFKALYSNASLFRTWGGVLKQHEGTCAEHQDREGDPLQEAIGAPEDPTAEQGDQRHVDIADDGVLHATHLISIHFNSFHIHFILFGLSKTYLRSRNPRTVGHNRKRLAQREASCHWKAAQNLLTAQFMWHYVMSILLCTEMAYALDVGPSRIVLAWGQRGLLCLKGQGQPKSLLNVFETSIELGALTMMDVPNWAKVIDCETIGALLMYWSFLSPKRAKFTTTFKWHDGSGGVKEDEDLGDLCVFAST